MKDTLIMVVLGISIYLLLLIGVWATKDFLKEWRD